MGKITLKSVLTRACLFIMFNVILISLADTDCLAVVSKLNKYDFKCTYANGDYYSGSVYADYDKGYSVGYKQSFTDENGQNGTYQITGMVRTSTIWSEGNVFVTSYYDSESKESYTPLYNRSVVGGSVAGTNYLGSESDYIVENKTECKFGYGAANNRLYEADIPGTSEPDIPSDVVGRIYNVIDYGAKPNDSIDDTIYIQKASDQAYKDGGGTVYFSPGLYYVKSVKLKEGITYLGDNATIKRPDNMPYGTRTFDANYTYSGMVDSKPIIIKGLTFDGNSQNQGAYKNYELEHADLVFLRGDLSKPGKLKTIIEDCTFKNSVSDGVAAFYNTDTEVYNCTFENCFRAGFSLTGGYSIATLKNNTIKGTIDPSSFDIESSSYGYGGSYKVIANVENLSILDGGSLDIGFSADSVFTGNNIRVEAPLNAGAIFRQGNAFFNLYAGDNSKVVISNSQFDIKSGNTIYYPNDVTFNNCTFYATESGIAEGNNTLHAAPKIAWNTQYHTYENQSVIFNDCNFAAKANVEAADTVYGIYTGIDNVSYNNVLTVTGGQFSDNLDVGVGMQYRGGNWVIRNATFDSYQALKWVGYDLGFNEYVNILLDGIKVNGPQFMFAQDMAPTGSNLDKLEVRNITLSSASNYISSYDSGAAGGIEGIYYIGHREIIGTTAPTAATHGLEGDIYSVGTSKWKCTDAGFFNVKTGKNDNAVWTKL